MPIFHSINRKNLYKTSELSNNGDIMKGYAIIKTGEHGWIDVDEPVAGHLDAICKPIAVAPCSSDTHAMHAGIGPT